MLQTPQSQLLSRRMPSPIRAQVSARWYASEADKSKESGDASAEAKDGKAAEEDPAKKELEAKNREIIDLKVGI